MPPIGARAPIAVRRGPPPPRPRRPPAHAAPGYGSTRSYTPPRPAAGIASRRTYIAPQRPTIASRRTYVSPKPYRAVGQAPHTHTAGGRGSVAQTLQQHRALARDLNPPPMHTRVGADGPAQTFPAAVIPGAHVAAAAAHLGGGLKYLERAGHDLITLPVATAQAGTALGSALAKDAYYSLTGQGYKHRNDLAHLAGGMVSSSPEGQLLTGHPGRALHTVEQHPGYAAMGLLGDLGAVGGAAGALARSGRLGEGAARLASTARDARELAPGLRPVEQHYSGNVLIKPFQRLSEEIPAFGRIGHAITGRSTKTILNKRADFHHADATNAMHQRVHAEVEQLKAEMPHVTRRLRHSKRLNEADLAPELAAGRIDHRTAVEDAQRRLADLQAAEAQHHAAKSAGEHAGQLLPPILKANQEHQRILKDFIAHPEQVAGARDVALAHVHRMAELDKEQADLGLLHPDQAETRALTEWALHNMEGARYEPHGIADPLAEHAKQAQADVKTEAARAREAEKEAAVLRKQYTQHHRDVADARVAVEKAKGSLKASVSHSTGKYSLRRVEARELPLRPSLARDVAESKLHEASQALDEQRAAAQADRVERLQKARDITQATKENLADAKKDAADLAPHLTKKIRGLVLRHEDGIERPLGVDEIKAEMQRRGADPVGYVTLRTPMKGDRTSYSLTRLTRGGSKGPRATYVGTKSGATIPGYGALSESRLSAIKRISRAHALDNVVRHDALKNEDGTTMLFNEDNPVLIHNTIERYHNEHGVELTPMYSRPKALSQEQWKKINGIHNADRAAEEVGQAALDARTWADDGAHQGDRVVLVPKAITDRLQAHMKADANTSNLIGRANRQFRNTVLPFSVKWLTGNTAEAAIRAALVHAGPLDHRFQRAVIARMRELGRNEEADRLERLTNLGLHYGMQHRMNEELIGHDQPADHPAVEAARQVGIHYTNMVQRIYEVNRRIESGAEGAVLGQHMKNQLHELLQNMTKAERAKANYVDLVAHHMGNPDKALSLAEEAGTYIHQTLGQYDKFSPAMKQFIRKYAPFSPWYLNSLRFVYRTMPMEHPIVQSILLDAHRADAEQWAKDHQDLPPNKFGPFAFGDLQSALRMGPHAYTNLARYTPWGAFSAGPSDFVANELLPQFSGAIHAYLGQDPFGNALRDKHGVVTNQATQAADAISALLAGFAGPLEVAERVGWDRGRTPYSGSTLWHREQKPNTFHGPKGLGGLLGGAARVFDPFMPTHLSRNTGHGGPAKQEGSGGGAKQEAPAKQETRYEIPRRVSAKGRGGGKWELLDSTANPRTLHDYNTANIQMPLWPQFMTPGHWERSLGGPHHAFDTDPNAYRESRPIPNYRKPARGRKAARQRKQGIHAEPYYLQDRRFV